MEKERLAITLIQAVHVYFEGDSLRLKSITNPKHRLKENSLRRSVCLSVLVGV